MTALPASGTFNTDDDLTEAELRQALEDVRNCHAELIGGSQYQALTISGGTITPAAGASGTLRVDAAASADLDTMSWTNIPDGKELRLFSTDAARVITIKHNTGAALGRFQLTGGFDYKLTSTTQYLHVRRDGNHFYEIARYGKEAISGISYGSGWSAQPNANQWRYANNDIHLMGDYYHATLAVQTSTIMTLPSPYRPFTTAYFPIYATVNAVGQVAHVNINSSGVVQLTLTSAPGAVPVHAYLDPIRFASSAY